MAAGLFASSTATAQQSGSNANAQPMKCDTGPVTKAFGATRWLVYSCVDGKTVIILTEPGNPAAPFIFYLIPAGGGYSLSGEGTGDKAASDAAGRDLETLSPSQIGDLVAQTRATAKRSPLSR